MDSDFALKRQLGVLSNLYKAVLWHVLWVTCDVTLGDLWNLSGNEAVKRSKVPL
jgi:hypothetical protein